MGKMIFFISAVVFIELLLLSTGQICNGEECSISSVIFNAILEFKDVTFSAFFKELIGDILGSALSSTGLKSLFVASGVIVGATLFAGSETRLFVPIAFTLGLIAGDFVFLFTGLGLNPVLSAFLIIPIGIIFIMVTVDWLRGKD